MVIIYLTRRQRQRDPANAWHCATWVKVSDLATWISQGPRLPSAALPSLPSESSGRLRSAALLTEVDMPWRFESG